MSSFLRGYPGRFANKIKGFNSEKARKKSW